MFINAEGDPAAACPVDEYAPVGGYMSMENNVYTYGCDAGYTLVGPATRTCTGGVFTPADGPTCQG